MRSRTFKTIAKPHLIISQQRKHLFISYGILMPNNYKLLPILHQLPNILTKQRERRLDTTISLLSIILCISCERKSPVFKICQYILIIFQKILYVGQIDSSIAILIFYFRYLHLIGNLLWFVIIEAIEMNCQFITCYRRTIVTGTR